MNTNCSGALYSFHSKFICANIIIYSYYQPQYCALYNLKNILSYYDLHYIIYIHVSNSIDVYTL